MKISYTIAAESILRKTVLLALLFSVSLPAQFFRTYRPFNDSVNLHGLSILSPEQLYVFGEYGYILKSTDGGLIWRKQNLGSGQSLSSLYFTDEWTGFAGGKNNTILRTTDGGITWSGVNSLVGSGNEWVIRFCFANRDYGFALSSTGRIFKTMNAGLHWFELPQFAFERFTNIIFFTEQTGLILGAYGELYRTTDGGQSWNLSYTGLSSQYTAVQRVSEGLLVAAATGGIFGRSTDYGINWTFNTTGLNEIFDVLSFSDSLNGFAFSKSLKVFRTTNGGQAWIQVADMPSGYTPTNMGGTSDGVIYITCRLNKVLRFSLNSGWQPIALKTNSSLSEVDSYNRNYLFCAADNGLICYSLSSGSTWKYIQTEGYHDLHSLRFAADSSAWVSGDNGTVVKSTTRGQTWQVMETNTKRNLRSIFAFNKYTAIAVGDSGKIILTEDGGKNWNFVNSGTAENLTDIRFFYNSLRGVISGKNGTLLFTSDGGFTWNPQPIVYTGNLNKVCVLGNFATALGDSGNIVSTTDAGVTWASRKITSAPTISGGVYYSPSSYLILTGKGNVLNVNVGSLAASNYYVNSAGLYLTDALVSDSKSVSFISREGIVLRYWASTDPGIPVELLSFSGLQSNKKIYLSWKTATETNNRGFEIQKSINNKDWVTIGFAAGNGTTTEPSSYSFFDNYPSRGVLYYRLKQVDYDGKAEVLRQIEIINDAVFELDQNFPNPFNPVTEISYGLPSGNYVSLKVYDALGRMVTSLVNGYQEAGRHTMIFDGTRLSSGIYYYRLTSGPFTLIKKMQLIK